MMQGRTANMYIDGTSALKVEGSRAKAAIIPFPQMRVVDRRNVLISSASTVVSSARVRIRHILEASEMYCSLKFEDFRGCAYNLFTQRGAAMLTASITVIAALSIAIGA